MIGPRMPSLRTSNHRSPGHPFDRPRTDVGELVGIGTEVLPRTRADVADDVAAGVVEIGDGRLRHLEPVDVVHLDRRPTCRSSPATATASWSRRAGCQQPGHSTGSGNRGSGDGGGAVLRSPPVGTATAWAPAGEQRHRRERRDRRGRDASGGVSARATLRLDLRPALGSDEPRSEAASGRDPVEPERRQHRLGLLDRTREPRGVLSPLADRRGGT